MIPSEFWDLGFHMIAFFLCKLLNHIRNLHDAIHYAGENEKSTNWSSSINGQSVCL